MPELRQTMPSQKPTDAKAAVPLSSRLPYAARFSALLFVGAISLISGCSEPTDGLNTDRSPKESAHADLQEITSHFSGKSKEIISLAWPKVSQVCPGLVKYRGDFHLESYQDNTYRDDFAGQVDYKFLEVGIKIAESSVASTDIVRYGAIGQFCGFRISPDGHFVSPGGPSCLRVCLDQADVPDTEGDLYMPLDDEGRSRGEQFALNAGTRLGRSVGYVFAEDAYNTISKEAIAQRLSIAELALNSEEFSSEMRVCHTALVGLGAGKYADWTKAVGRACLRLPAPQQARVLEIAAKSLTPDVPEFYAIEDIIGSVKPKSTPSFDPVLANAYSEWGAMGGNLQMRKNHIYSLRAHGDYVGACAWGLISHLENESEIAGDPHMGEQLLRGCKPLRPDQEPEVKQTMQTLLSRAENL